MNLLRDLANRGIRVFGYNDIIPILKKNNFSQSYSNRLLYEMSKRGEIQNLGHGIYSLPTELLAGGPIHAFEIAICIAKKGAISFRSAMSFHDMTDQVFSSVYVTSPRSLGSNLSTKSEYNIEGNNFYIKRINEKNFFGVKRFFIGSVTIWITDPEKTLLDGLCEPELCGGFREVMYAFEQAADNINSVIFMEYINKLPTVIAKRAGWMLEQLGQLPDLQNKLIAIRNKTPQKLNPMGPRKGKLNKRWQLMENTS